MKRTARYLAFLSLIGALVAVLVAMNSRPALANRAAQTYSTPMATAASSTSSSSTTGAAYSAAHPAPIVPAGAAVVSESATTNGTLVVYHSGGLYYNVTYFPSGRYVYSVTGAPSAAATTTVATPVPTTSTLPQTGGAEPTTPGLPVLPLLLALGLSVLGATTWRLARTMR